MAEQITLGQVIGKPQQQSLEHSDTKDKTTQKSDDSSKRILSKRKAKCE